MEVDEPRVEFKLRCELIGHQEDVSAAAIVLVSLLVARLGSLS